MNPHSGAPIDKAEAERRASRTDLIEQLFPRPPVRVDRGDGAGAHRRVTRAGEGTIDGTGRRDSIYRYVPLRRFAVDAATMVAQRSLFIG